MAEITYKKPRSHTGKIRKRPFSKIGYCSSWAGQRSDLPELPEFEKGVLEAEKFCQHPSLFVDKGNEE